MACTLVGDGAWVGAGGWGGGQGLSGVGTHGCGAGGAKQQLGAQLDTHDVEQIGGHGIVDVKVPGGATVISLRVTNSFIGAGSLLAFARRYCWRAAVGSIGRPLGPKVRANFTVTFAFGFFVGTFAATFVGLVTPPVGFGVEAFVGTGVTLMGVI